MLEAGVRCCGASKTGLAPWPKSKGEALQLADESVVAILRQVSDLDILGVRRYLSLESYVITDMSSLWADLEAGPSSRGMVPELWGSGAGCGPPSPGRWGRGGPGPGES